MDMMDNWPGYHVELYLFDLVFSSFRVVPFILTEILELHGCGQCVLNMVSKKLCIM